MDANDVARYLEQNPRFFETRAELLGTFTSPSPANQAIPIADRQLLILREKMGELETRMRELIRFGGENDAIGEKLHRATLALFAASDLDTTLAVLYHTLQEDFGVPQVALRLWENTPDGSALPELARTSDALRDFAVRMGAPHCGNSPPFETSGWFDLPEQGRSYAFLPLRTSRTFGLVGLASDDPRRFAPGMGTVYLTRLSELASVAIARFLAAG